MTDGHFSAETDIRSTSSHSGMMAVAVQSWRVSIGGVKPGADCPDPRVSRSDRLLLSMINRDD